MVHGVTWRMQPPARYAGRRLIEQYAMARDAALLKGICAALIAVSPFALLAIGMNLSWWIPGLFAWPAALIYYLGVRTTRVIRIAGVLLLTVVTGAWVYSFASNQDWSLLAVYFVYPLLTIVATLATLIDVVVRTRERAG